DAATSSANTSDAWVSGQPATAPSISLTPIGTPPSGSDTSAVAAAARASSGSTWQNAFSPDDSMAARLASSASVGETSLARKASTNEQASSSQEVAMKWQATGHACA